MPELNSIIICDKVDFSPENKVNIYGVFDSIYARSFPAVHSSLAIFVRMEIREEEIGNTYRHYYEIKYEDGTNVFTYPEEDLVATKRRHQLVHKFDGLSLERPGKYIVNIYINGELFAKTYFLAKIIQ